MGGRVRTSLCASLAACLLPAVPAPARPGAAGPAPVVVVVLENHGYGQVVGNADAPYLNCTGSFAGTGLVCNGKLYTGYRGLFHPSLPNYLAMASGSNDGCTSDSCTPDSVRRQSLFQQLSGAGLRWNAFQESMTVDCERLDDSNDVYVVHHNPPAYFRPLGDAGLCRAFDVPFAQMNASALPPFSFVTPNLCHDMHGASGPDCTQGYPQCSNLICVADAWLSENVPPLLAAGADVLVTFDEPRRSEPATARLAAVQVGPGVAAGSTDSRAYDHYSLLRGLEDGFGLACLQLACSATPLPIGS